MSLKNKKILITAGPTWAPIDKVRVISNTATGKTGILLATGLSKLGANVTLMLGPVGQCKISDTVKVLHFKFFDELKSLVKKELKERHYDVVIQSAAVSDYVPLVYRDSKLSSGQKRLKLTLKPSLRIIDSLRKDSPRSFLVGFKFEPDLSGTKLINKARQLLLRARLDLVVANTARDSHYTAYLVNPEEEAGPFLSRVGMTKALVGLIERKYAGNQSS